MSKPEVLEKIKVAFADYGLNEKQLTLEASFSNDLGLDSLDFVGLILTVEQIFDISISFEHDAMNTIEDLVNTIAQKSN